MNGVLRYSRGDTVNGFSATAMLRSPNGIYGFGVLKFNERGRIPCSSASSALMTPARPDADSRWPILVLIDPIGSGSERPLPRNLPIAPASIGSPHGTTRVTWSLATAVRRRSTKPGFARPSPIQVCSTSWPCPINRAFRQTEPRPRRECRTSRAAVLAHAGQSGLPHLHLRHDGPAQRRHDRAWQHRQSGPGRASEPGGVADGSRRTKHLVCLRFFRRGNLVGAGRRRLSGVNGRWRAAGNCSRT